MVELRGNKLSMKRVSFHSGSLPRPALRTASTAYRLAASLDVRSPPPRVFVVSYPKAGTHLLRRLLDSLPQMRYSGLHLQGERLGGDRGRSLTCVAPRMLARVERQLRHVRQGQYVTAHLGYDPRLAEILDSLGYISIFATRDPRDVVVSYADWARRIENHHLHSYWEDTNASREACIMDVIVGLEAGPSQSGIESLKQRIEAYLPWLSYVNHVSRFERLIGCAGGGSATEQRHEVRAVSSVVRRPMEDAAVVRAGDRLWSPESATFRRGQIGEWRVDLTAEHLDALKDAGSVASELGYTFE